MENPARNVERQPKALAMWRRLYAAFPLFFPVIPTGESSAAADGSQRREHGNTSNIPSNRPPSFQPLCFASCYLIAVIRYPTPCLTPTNTFTLFPPRSNPYTFPKLTLFSPFPASLHGGPQCLPKLPP